MAPPRPGASSRYRALFAEIGPGLTFMAMHANAPGEIELIEPDTAAIRIEEYECSRRRADRLDRRPARAPWHPLRFPDSLASIEGSNLPDPAAEEANRICDRRQKDEG